MVHKCVLAGVGGQGILYATRIMHDAALLEGYSVRASETHGMAQRGGSVVSHLLIDQGRSPLVRKGTADMLMVFEPEEVFRTLSFLKKDGELVMNAPHTRVLGIVEEYLKLRGTRVHILDANVMADQMGSVMAGNIMLLGFALKCVPFPFSFQSLRTVIESGTRSIVRDLNLRALDLGFQEGNSN
jgi:indolepyruvate ferredoxin oxidoreductase, beta subunit